MLDGIFTNARHPQDQPENTPPGQTIVLKGCPRCCDGALSFDGEEWICIHCGNEDYFRARPSLESFRSRLSFDHAPEQTASYAHDGTYQRMRQVTVRYKTVIKFVAGGNTKRTILAWCPFCGGAMDQTAPTPRMRNAGESRFRCGEGHRISLFAMQNGDMVWRE